MGVDIISEAFFIARTGHRHVELTAKEDSMNAVALTPSFVHIFNSNANLVIFFIITFFCCFACEYETIYTKQDSAVFLIYYRT